MAGHERATFRGVLLLWPLIMHTSGSYYTASVFGLCVRVTVTCICVSLRQKLTSTVSVISRLHSTLIRPAADSIPSLPRRTITSPFLRPASSAGLPGSMLVTTAPSRRGIDLLRMVDSFMSPIPLMVYSLACSWLASRVLLWQLLHNFNSTGFAASCEYVVLPILGAVSTHFLDSARLPCRPGLARQSPCPALPQP